MRKGAKKKESCRSMREIAELFRNDDRDKMIVKDLSSQVARLLLPAPALERI